MSAKIDAFFAHYRADPTTALVALLAIAAIAGLFVVGGLFRKDAAKKGDR